MAHKKKHSAPVPVQNQPKAGPQAASADQSDAKAPGGAPFSDQDAKRRLGGFETAGEHALKQPSRLNDGQQHSR